MGNISWGFLDFRKSFLFCANAVIIMSLLLFMVACLNLDDNPTLRELEVLDDDFNLIEIHRYHYHKDEIVNAIDDHEKMELIMTTLHQYAHGWRNYIDHTPPAPISIRFKEDKEIRFMVQIGYTYKTSSGNPIYYLSYGFGSRGRPLEESEFKEIMSILEIDEHLALH